MWWIPTADAQSFMPPAATKIAESVDSLYAFLLISSLISFIILMGGLAYFVNKYRRRSKDDKTAYITHDHTLEFIWSFVPFVIFMICFGWGAKIYLDMRTMPDEEGLQIHVNAKKWDWEFMYKNGRTVTSEIGENNEKIPPTMVVPVNRPVHLIMTSTKVNPADKKDRAVLHSFFVPAFRVKQDIVPGKYTQLSFTPTKTGSFWIFCTEYCGTGHSNMLGRVEVVEETAFNDWVIGDESGSKELSLADQGKKIAASRACLGCHSLDGGVMTGPTWKGLFGSQKNFADGSSAKADENYLRESILNPNAKVVQGYPPNQMPAFQGMLTDEEVTAVIEFIKSVE